MLCGVVVWWCGVDVLAMDFCDMCARMCSD